MFTLGSTGFLCMVSSHFKLFFVYYFMLLYCSFCQPSVDNVGLLEDPDLHRPPPLIPRLSGDVIMHWKVMMP